MYYYDLIFLLMDKKPRINKKNNTIIPIIWIYNGIVPAYAKRNAGSINPIIVAKK